MAKHARKGTVWLLTVFYSLLLFYFIGLPRAEAATDIWDGTADTGFADGAGTSGDPYQIATGEQLAYLASLANGDADGLPTSGKYYILTADINLNSIAWTPIGITYFRGNFDGDGHVISNLSIGSSGTPDSSGKALGLFGNAAGCTIQNVGVENVAIYGSSSGRIGGLAGQIVAFSTTPSTVKNCYTSGIVNNGYTSTAYAGGLAGYCGGSSSPDFTVILNCSSSANVIAASASGRAGGLFGNSMLSSIRNCFATGNVSNQNTTYTGGLIGRNQSATISYAYWNGSASQTAGGTAQDPKRGIGTDDTGTAVTTSKTSTELKEAAFVTLLNAHNESEGNWGIVSGANGGYPVPFSAAPAISLNPATDKTFTAQVEGYAAQTAHSVTINNTGSAETGALTVALSGTNPTAYSLSATSLSSIAAGSSGSFTVAPVTGLTPGTYSAVVTVSGSSVTLQTFNVSFTVNAATYTITANKESLPFGSAVEGYATAPDAQTVTLTNTGNSSFTVTLPTSTNYDVTASTSLTLAPAGAVVVSVQPKTGLATGTHNETLTFETDHSTSDSVDATFTVSAATYTISASKDSLPFGSVIEGYSSAPSAQTVVLTNTGNSSFTVTLPTSTSYDITTSDSLTLAPAATATISVQPKTGLVTGTYNETLTFATNHSTSDSVDATFSVSAPTYTISASKDSLPFGSVIEGYSSAPTAQTVTLTNTGNSSFTVTLPTSTNYDITTSDSLTLAPAATATVSIQPKTGLVTGTYDETLTFETDHSTSDSVDAAFSVGAATYTIEANQTSLAFGSKVEGYATAPDAQTVTLTNSGNSSFTVTLPTSTNYDVTASTSLTLAPSGTVVVSVRPKTGLTNGAHDETLAFETDHSTSDSVDATFSVGAATYTIEADQTSLDFGSRVEGYLTAPKTQKIIITNTGNSDVELTLPTNANYEISSLDSLTLAPSATAIVHVRPITGLSVGTYDPTLIVTTNHSTSVGTPATFTVIAATYTLQALPATLDFGNAIEGYSSAPAEQTVTLTNTGNSAFTVTLPTSAGYTVSTSDSLTLAEGDTATVGIQPKTGLSAGAHDETLTFTTDHSTNDGVDVSFTVNAAVYTLSANPTVKDFGSQTIGYSPVAEETVTITNTGNKISTIVQPSAVDYTVGTLSRTVLNPGDTATFTVKPKDGLAVGTYAETVSVEGTGSAEATTDVTFEVLPIEYSVTGDATFYQNTPDGLVFTSNGSFDIFTGVTVDGVPLNNTQYGAAEGSTIVTLYTSFLNTLPLGSHTMLIQFRDGFAEAGFDVLPTLYSPETGDNNAVTLYIILAALSLTALIVVGRRRARR